MRLESGEVLVDAGGRHGNIGKGGDGAGEGNPGATYRCLHKRLRLIMMIFRYFFRHPPPPPPFIPKCVSQYYKTQTRYIKERKKKKYIYNKIFLPSPHSLPHSPPLLNTFLFPLLLLSIRVLRK